MHPDSLAAEEVSVYQETLALAAVKGNSEARRALKESVSQQLKGEGGSAEVVALLLTLADAGILKPRQRRRRR